MYVLSLKFFDRNEVARDCDLMVDIFHEFKLILISYECNFCLLLGSSEYGNELLVPYKAGYLLTC